MQKRTVGRLAAGVALALGIVAAALMRAAFEPSPATRTIGSTPAEPLDSAPSGSARPSAPALPRASTATAASTTPPLPRPAGPLDEPALMARLRGIRDEDPTAAIELAREGNRRFPDSPDAPERASILIHALARLGRVSEARGEAEDMVSTYPDSNWVREIEAFTGAHRHRDVHIADDGAIEFY